MKRLVALFACSLFATEPNAATRNWWRHVQALANDDMKGRDTGSPEYQKAAEYVAEQFKKAGATVTMQPVPMRREKLDATFDLVDASGQTTALLSRTNYHNSTGRQLLRTACNGWRP